ncbi:AAA family ATPase [Pseudomonas leptonychotis]|uniref:Protein CR006 P-loop domain-containing protein n=1 Tax=Pseudomonas leptonychotis TaxID=2448482 RepID=A0A4T1ZTU9_9PSED|nr:AAA family ATPase [Pseudomonas leptonychotis]TIH07487.1 hypothetical protein D8779_15110 [Pseudomonas leptonychotis]
MSILQEIFLWSQKSLAPWQQDAVSRLYVNRTMADADLEDLYALAKAEHGIVDPSGRQSKPLAAGQFVAAPLKNRLVQLTAIKDFVNVNALAEGMRLPISPNGLTVIYGENGAGKSGYSRVLKQACRARDQRELILPDARKEPGKVGPAQAVFEATVDGQPIELHWVNGKESPEQLSEIAIFDSLCARAYIDNQGDFAYVPYGLDILGGLVAVCSAIKDKATTEKRLNTPNIAIFSTLAQTSTAVGRALKAIPGATKAPEVEALATLSVLEADRLITLNKVLAEADPKQKAQVLQLRAQRLTDLSVQITAAVDSVSDAKILELKRLVETSSTARRAAELAAGVFKETPGLLPGTGGDEWKALLDAARAFATQSHAGHQYPHLPDDSPCPLCQNPLGQEGVDRLASFDAFIAQAAERAWKDARKAAMDALRAFEVAKPNIQIDAALKQELNDASPEAAVNCSEIQCVLLDRHAQALAACVSKYEWSRIQPMPVEPCRVLLELTTRLESDAKALEAAMDEKAKAAMVVEQAELDARTRLIDFKIAVLDAIAKHEHSSKLQACIESISPAGISRKATELSKTTATQEVADALNAELRSLNVHELQVVMKPVSPGGKTQFKLALQLPGGSPPAAVLSEGEQRAIAIAAFLAEMQLGKGLGGVVFDDPVSSLDHRRRWEVAARLAAEAKKRQVIVFTHDIYFLCILQQKAEEADAELSTQCIRRTGAGFGVQTDRIPFDKLKTKARIGALRQLHVSVERAYKAGEEDDYKRLTRDAYYHLRLAWERAVEEVLFQSVIQRFNEGVSTQNLRYVVVEDDDYAEIDAGMTKSSKFEHDAAAPAQLPTPHPDELKGDIERLETWRAAVEARKQIIEAQRK